MLKVENFKAGQLSTKIRNSKNLTKDQNMLDIVQGDSINLINKTPCQHFARNPSLSTKEEKLIEKEIDAMIEKGVIKKYTRKAMNLYRL